MTRTIIDIHVLQTVPPSNLNRDDTGSPKTAIYGGTRRARVSSQAWKRATRTAFADLIAEADLGVRTKRVVELVADQIRAIDAEFDKSESEELAGAILGKAGITVTKPKKVKGDDDTAQSGYLLFLSRQQIINLANLAVDAEHAGTEVEKSAAKDAADRDHSVDLALFGRMVADAPDLNVDASAQVAHAISVHSIENEYDYFTAMDDLAPKDNAGAGMIGTVEFNSSTLYRYATVNVDALHGALGTPAATAAAVAAFVRAFITSMPTGKQNTFANRTLPDAVVVSVRDSQSVNLAGAFEDAVVTETVGGRLREASDRLVKYAQDIDRVYSQKPVATYVLGVGPRTESLSELGNNVSIDELIDRLSSLVRDRVQEIV